MLIALCTSLWGPQGVTKVHTPLAQVIQVITSMLERMCMSMTLVKSFKSPPPRTRCHRQHPHGTLPLWNSAIHRGGGGGIIAQYVCQGVLRGVRTCGQWNTRTGGPDHRVWHTGGSLRGKEKTSVRERQFCKKTACSSYIQPWLVAIGGWRLVATGDWRLAVGDWRLVVVDGGWRRLVVDDWWLVAVGSGWWLAVGRRWRLVAVGGWWSLGAVRKGGPSQNKI